MLGDERLPNRLQIITGIEPFRHLADVLAERFAIAQERRAREHVDLGAGVVDVIFPDDVVAGEPQQAAQRVAEHRAPAMADMHRPGGVGRDIFDIDLLGRAHRAPAIGRALTQHGAQRVRPGRGFQGQIDEAGTGDVDRGNQIIGAEPGRDRFGEIARFCLGLLGQHHRRIGRHVAMRGVARRLDHDPRQVDTGGPAAFGGERAAHRVDAPKHVGEQMLCRSFIDHGRYWTGDDAVGG